jgi:hypothetical protein
MGKIEVRLSNKYNNEFMTTTTGYIIRKEQWTEVDEEDFEISKLIIQKGMLEVRGEDTLKNKIILDIPDGKTIKEVVGEKVMEENRKAIKEHKHEQRSNN